jgi:predicted DNA-binding protein (MmcQ/YjbR family)
MAARKKPLDIIDTLRKIALAYPETHEDHPWGHFAFKVRGKGFVFAGSDEDGTRLSVKLPQSREMALAMPCTEPTHYGMGKYGWVTATLKKPGDVPLPLLEDWIDESYRAVAPKKLVASLATAVPAATVKKKAKKKTAAKKTRASHS